MSFSTSKYFDVAMLRCKCGCGLAKFHLGFIQKLDQLQNALNWDMEFSSVVRCAAHNAKVGGHHRSLHVGDEPYWKIKGMAGTLAADVLYANGQQRGDLFEKAWERGWSVGWGKGFLHIDWRIVLPGFDQTTFDY